MGIYENCVLRHAAGMYWIVKIKQDKDDYRNPVCTNETGAWIWERICKGVHEEQIAQELASEFHIPNAMATQDVRAFIRQLEEQLLRNGE